MDKLWIYFFFKITKLGQFFNDMNHLTNATKNAALGYAWIYVSFDTWFKGLENLADLVAWKQWPNSLKSIGFAAYPFYFAYSSSQYIASYKADGSFPVAQRRKYHVAMCFLFIIGSFIGMRRGTAARLLAAGKICVDK